MVQGSVPLIDRRPLRVAFTAISRRVSAGAHNYQLNLFAALGRYCPGEIIPVLFAGTKDDPSELAAFSQIPAVEVARSSVFDRQRLFSALVFGLDRPASAQFRNKRIDAVFESARFFGWRLPIPAIAWFPDFQHLRLPQLFSPAVRWRRELGFRAQIMSGRHIMLSSESALGDFRKFYPGRTDVSVVRFATSPDAALLTANIAEILNKYDLPPRYFYLPNQFWRHKNHQVVVNALTILKQRACNIVVAASGSPKDTGGTDYFDNLMREVAARGLKANFRYLGMIPLDHVYALLRTAVAVINPSRFEGWSTTVEEAKSFGVPLLLSDIDVHREQARDTACYFGLDDPATLADMLWRTMQNAPPVVTRDLQPGLDRRVAAFAEDFARVVRNKAQSSQVMTVRDIQANARH